MGAIAPSDGGLDRLKVELLNGQVQAKKKGPKVQGANHEFRRRKRRICRISHALESGDTVSDKTDLWDKPAYSSSPVSLAKILPCMKP